MPTYRAPIDLTTNELRNAVIQVLSAAPSSPQNGRIYYDSTIPGFRGYVNGGWVTFGAGSAAATTSAEGIVQLAGDLAGSGTTAAAPLIGSASELVNGSVSSPSVRFAASQSTGLYSTAADTLDLAAGGVRVITATGTAITLRQAVTISTGGLGITAGGLSITAGGLTIGAGGGSLAAQAGSFAGTLSANGGLSVAASQAINFGGNTPTNSGTPSSSTDVANKAYVDSVAQGLSVKPSAVVETTGAETYTIASGSVTQISGTTVNGVSPAIGDRILIKDAPAASGAGSAGSTEPANGLYIVTSTTTNLSVSRDTSMSGANGPAGAFVFVEKDAAGYTVSTPSTNAAFTYGTNNIAWTQFSGAGEITAGTGLSKSGNTLSIENGGVLLTSHGGTGVASPTAHGVLVGEGASAIASIVGSTSGQPLLAAGSGSDPAFGALNLAGASAVTGSLPIGNGGTGASTAAGARTALAAAAVATHTLTGDSSTTTFSWTPTPTPTTTGTWHVSIINQSTGAVEYADVTINQTTSQITITFGTAPATGTNYTVIAVG